MCEVCLAIKEKKDLLYEDGVCAILYPSKGVSEGHLRIYPKEHVTRLADIPKRHAVHMFKIAGKVASVLFENLGAEGTNIICNDALLDEHLSINVITRKGDDKLGLMWEPKPADRTKLDEMEAKLKPQCQYIASRHEEKEEESAPLIKNIGEKKGNIDESEEEINYLIRQINRIP